MMINVIPSNNSAHAMAAQQIIILTIEGIFKSLLFQKDKSMKGLISYNGQYGATQQYATWLGDQLQLPIMKEDEINENELRLTDFVVVAGSVYIGKWRMRDWVKQNSEILQGKKIFFLIVCATPASMGIKQGEIAKINIPDSLYKESEIFFLPGRLVISKLSWRDKFLLKMGARLEKNPETKARMLRDVDNVSKENLTDAVRRIKAFQFVKYGSPRIWRTQLVHEN